MYAQFHATGLLEIYDRKGNLVVSGRPGAKPGAEGHHPVIEYAVALMKHHGDWPENPNKAQRIELDTTKQIGA